MSIESGQFEHEDQPNPQENVSDIEMPSNNEEAAELNGESSFKENLKAAKEQVEVIKQEEKGRDIAAVDKRWFSKSKKWLQAAIAAGVLMTPFLAGCSKAENTQPETGKSQEVKKADSDGFTDDYKEVVKQRLKLRQQQIEADKKLQEQIKKATPQQKEDAKKAVDEMSKPLVPQESNQDGFSDESNPNAQRPKRDTKSGPTGRIGNPEDL